MTLYSVGDKVEYMTAGIQTLDRGRIPGEVKIGVIEEALLSLEQKPCYWIENEKQLIFHYQILRHFPKDILFETKTET